MPEPSVPTKQPIRIDRDLAFRVVVSSLALLTIYFLLRRNVAGYDLWGSLAFGALVDQGGFPSTDVFSFTANGREWISHSWGASVFFLRVLRDGGSSALFALKLLLFVAALSTSARIHRAYTTESETSLADAVFFLSGLPCCFLLLEFYAPTIASGTFSVLGFMAALWILDTYRRWPSTRAPWLLPPMIALGINLDGGFLLVFFALAVHLAWLLREGRRNQATELSVVALFSVFATLLNPYGWSYGPHVIETWVMGASPFSVDPVFAWTYAALASSVISATAVNTWHDRRFPGELLLLVGTALVGWLNVDHAPLFVLTALALGVPQILRLVEHYNVPQRMRDYVGLVIPGGLAVAALALVAMQVLAAGGDSVRPRVPAQVEGERNAYPLGAASYLADRTGPVRLWTPTAWGGFLSWRLFPNVLVSSDGRADAVYPSAVREDHVRFWDRRQDLTALENYDATHVLVPANNAAMLNKLDLSTSQRTYQDPVAVIYAREAPPSMPDSRANDTMFVDDLVANLSRFQTTRR